MPRKGRNLKRELAKRYYLDPESESFANKSKSLKRAGYKKSVAEHWASQTLPDANFTHKDLQCFETFISLVPQIDSLMQKKLQELSLSKLISAKDFANLINLLEKLAKMAGVFREVVEKLEKKVIVEYRILLCPKCGARYDPLAEEKEQLKDALEVGNPQIVDADG